MAAITVDGRHVWAVDAVVREVFVERLDPHGPDPLGDQVANRIIHHCGGDTGFQSEAIGQIGGDIELSATDVNVTVGRLPERDDSGIKAMHQRAEGQEIQGSSLAKI